jgi:hypothetical protein
MVLPRSFLSNFSGNYTYPAGKRRSRFPEAASIDIKGGPNHALPVLSLSGEK